MARPLYGFRKIKADEGSLPSGVRIGLKLQEQRDVKSQTREIGGNGKRETEWTAGNRGNHEDSCSQREISFRLTEIQNYDSSFTRVHRENRCNVNFATV